MGNSYILVPPEDCDPLDELQMGVPAWHLTKPKARLLRDGSPAPKEGETLMYGGVQPMLCISGLHASMSVFDALKYNPKIHGGHVRVNRVRCWEVHNIEKDKFVSRYRRVDQSLVFTEKRWMKFVEYLQKTYTNDNELAKKLAELLSLKAVTFNPASEILRSLYVYMSDYWQRAMNSEFRVFFRTEYEEEQKKRKAKK